MSGRPTKCRYCRHPATKKTLPWQPFFGFLYMGAYWPPPCAAAMRPYVKLL